MDIPIDKICGGKHANWPIRHIDGAKYMDNRNTPIELVTPIGLLNPYGTVPYGTVLYGSIRYHTGTVFVHHRPIPLRFM